MKDFWLESLENFKANVLGIRSDIPGEEKISREVLKIWLIYFFNIFMGIFSGFFSYVYVAMSYVSVSKHFTGIVMSLAMFWNAFLALVASSMIAAALLIGMRFFFLKDIDDEINVFSNGIAMFLFFYVITTVICYTFHINVSFFVNAFLN